MMSIVTATTTIKQRLNFLQRIAKNRHVSQRISMSSTNLASCPLEKAENEKTIAKPFDAIPGPGGIYNIPYIGFLFHLKPFGKYTSGTMHHLFDEMIQRYGPIFKIRTNIPTVVITDPKDLAIMLRNEGKYPFRPNFDVIEVYHKRTGAPRSVGALQGADWWAARVPMQKVLLRPKQVSQYLPLMNGVADDFIELLTSDYPQKHTSEEMFMVYMAESAGTAFYNKRLGFLDKVQSEETKKMEQAMFDLFDLLLKTMIGKSNAFKYYRSKDYKRFEAAIVYMKEATARYVKEAKDDVKNKQKLGTFDSEEPNMLLSLLKEVPEEAVALAIEGLYFAAIDSSAAGLQVVLHALAKYQDKQEIVRKEIHDVLGDSDNNVTVTQEHLDKMRYLKACVKECYRCWAIIPFGPARILPVDTVLGGYNIPAGVQIYNYNSRACRDETIFENPNNFEPERWLRQSKQSNNNAGDNDSSWAVLPFGMGPRSCPGRRLFEQELFLLLAKLLNKMRIGLEPESMDVGFEYRLFLKSVKPLKFTFTPLDAKEQPR